MNMQMESIPKGDTDIFWQIYYFIVMPYGHERSDAVNRSSGFEMVIFIGL